MLSTFTETESLTVWLMMHTEKKNQQSLYWDGQVMCPKTMKLYNRDRHLGQLKKYILIQTGILSVSVWEDMCPVF